MAKSDELAEAAAEYAPFWRRFVALLVDGFIVGLLQDPWTFGWSMSAAATVAAYSAIRATPVAYAVFMHACWGATIGKQTMGIELRAVTGGKIGWRHALMRSSVDIVLTAAHLSLAIAAWRGGVPLAEGTKPLLVGKALQPSDGILTWIGVAWALAELITMFANKERRALHDLIGGTIVVRSATR